ncbi:MAG: sigma-54 dependent transcriptional regulator [Pseudomonadota bacterium]
MATPLLLVEDTATLSTLYETVLTRAGFDVTIAMSAKSARKTLGGHKPTVTVLDLMLPDGDGLEILQEIKRDNPKAKIIVITANGSVNKAVEAMQAGAFDFLVKPFDPDRLLSSVKNAQAAAEPDDRSGETSKELSGFIGTSDVMQRVYQTIEMIGRSAATVFITGESGTGKELCAQAIHDVSPRKDKSFVPLNCGAIPSDLLESEVFGHLRGSFTGAVADKVGAAVAADGGTLFLDEICEMDLNLQTKLLRFIQTSTVQPVGATTPRKVDVRILCATNRDPEKEVAEGRFRADLFYRLHVVPIEMPPLRDRGEDVITIAEKVLRDFATEEGREFASLSPTVRDLFRAHAWPGNVRQLLNVMRNVVVLNDGPQVIASMLPPGFSSSAGNNPATAAPTAQHTSANPIDGLIGQSLADVERRFIEATIAACDGSLPKAARILDVSPSTLYRKRSAWGVERDEETPA